MIVSLQHIALIISRERNLWFYEFLGFHECYRVVRKRDTVVLMVGHGMELEVFIDSSHPSHSSFEESCGLRHFALQIAPGGKIEDEIECLKSKSTEIIEFGPIMTDWTGTKYVFMKDPDGTVIELRE